MEGMKHQEVVEVAPPVVLAGMEILRFQHELQRMTVVVVVDLVAVEVDYVTLKRLRRKVVEVVEPVLGRLLMGINFLGDQREVQPTFVVVRIPLVVLGVHPY